MQIGVKYGSDTIPIHLPESVHTEVIHPEYVPGIADPAQAIRRAIDHPIGCAPLRELLKRSRSVGIVVSDATRATPNRTVLPRLIECAGSAGVPSDAITIFIATGTHRRSPEEEIDELLGADIRTSFRVVQNVCTDSASFVSVGTTENGNEVLLNRELVECDLRILTGYIEPHFFAGYSGGGKAIMPGCAALDTIVRNHGAANIDHPCSTWGRLADNPIAQEVREAAAMAGLSFLLNVSLNRDREITGVFAGDVTAAHAVGCARVEASAIKRVTQPFDLVITSNAGYPLDRNLYQSVKGMSAAAEVVANEGHIIVCAECRDGIPKEGAFGEILTSAPSPDAVLSHIRDGSISGQDVWQAQVLCRIAESATIHLYSPSLSGTEISAVHCRPVSDLDERIKEIIDARGSQARVCVLPEGPETIPSIA